MRWEKMLTVIGAHAEGEVGNVVTGGLVDVPGKTMWDKKQYIEKELDHIRRMLIFEPRGAPYHAVNYLLPSNHPDADIGFVIAEVGKYPPMSGSNTICVATVLLETGILEMTEPTTSLCLESPAGLIKVECQCDAGKVKLVEFQNVPSFVMHMDKIIEVGSLGSIRVDIAYGGIIFAIVDAASLGFELAPNEAFDMGRIGQKIRDACNEQITTVHPENPDIKGVANVIITGAVVREGDRIVSRNATMCNLGRLDRSPTGTGTSARMAVMYAKGQLELNQTFENASIIGTKFYGRISETTQIGSVKAIVTHIAGQAWITGVMQYGIDPTDPFPHGHKLSDVWF
jgi:proline racemase